MAFITLAGTLRDPTSELAVGDQIRFTHKSTTGETVEGAVSVLTIDPSGTYSKDLQYGLVLVEYKDVRTSQFKNLGVATVNGSNPATSIPELLNALVPVSSAELIEFQAILADAVTARNEAEAFANSIDLINDLSQAYIFDTVASMTDSLIAFPTNKTLKTKGSISVDDGKGSTYLVQPARSVDEMGDLTLNDGKVALIKSHISVETGVGTSEAALSIIIGDNTYEAKAIGEGSVLIGGYEEAHKNRLLGTTELRTIIAGYDNEITERGVADDGGLACVIVGSHHSEIKGDATHGTILGGSYLIITDGDYNGLIGGTLNELQNITARPTHSGIIFGRENIIGNANSFIAGSLRSTATGDFSSVISGQDSIAAGNFDTVNGSKNESRSGTLGNGQKNTISGGRYNIIDSSTSPVGNNISGGEDIQVFGLYNSAGGGIGTRIGDALINTTYATCPGGLDNIISAITAGTVGGGRGGEAAGDYSTVPGGRECKATAPYSTSKGYQAESRLEAFTAEADGQIAVKGDAQRLSGIRKLQTTGATVSATTSMVMEDNSTWRFECKVAAHEVGGSNAASFKITGLAQRGVGAGTVAFVGVPTIVNEFATGGAATWTAKTITNTGSGAIRAELTGEAAKTINWVTHWEMLELLG